MTRWLYTSDKYGREGCQFDSPEQFVAACAEVWPDHPIELSWQTDGDAEWYADQDGDVVLEGVPDD